MEQISMVVRRCQIIKGGVPRVCFETRPETREEMIDRMEKTINDLRSALAEEKAKANYFSDACKNQIGIAEKATNALAEKTAQVERLRGALEDVDRQFSAYEDEGKRYSGCSIYLKITKAREALAATAPDVTK